MILFFGILLASLGCVRIWGLRSAFLKLCLFSASNSSIPKTQLTIVRMGAAICGIIVASDNYDNINVIVAEVVLSQVGSFMIYYTLVSFYHAS
jgi:hypothetical protein